MRRGREGKSGGERRGKERGVFRQIEIYDYTTATKCFRPCAILPNFGGTTSNRHASHYL